MTEVEKKWEKTGILEEFNQSDRDFVAGKLEDLCDVIKTKNIQVPPAIIYTLVVMIRDKISYGSLEWFVENFVEYYNKHPDVEGFDKEDHYNHGRIQFRIFDYLKWLENRRSLIL